LEPCLPCRDEGEQRTRRRSPGDLRTRCAPTFADRRRPAVTRPFCLTLFALGCVALLAGFADSFASWGMRGDGLGLAEAARRIVAERHRRQHLEALDRVTLPCLEGKVRVTDDLAAGRLSPEEAVALFGRLEDERDEQLGRAPAARGPKRDARLQNRAKALRGTSARGTDQEGSGPEG
jgi:hypothetical protein